MIVFLFLISNFLLFSLIINVIFYRRLKKPTQLKQQTYDVKALLSDLASGGALVKIERVDPSHVFFKSPRELD